MKNYELIDNADRKQYEFHINGKVAKIEYMKSRNGNIYLTHTEVPPSLEGQGIASALTKQVLEDIERQGLKAVPMCGFVATYIRRHPEWERVVMEGVNV